LKKLSPKAVGVHLARICDIGTLQNAFDQNKNLSAKPPRTRIAVAVLTCKQILQTNL
jgi:hypothetical protein